MASPRARTEAAFRGRVPRRGRRPSGRGSDKNKRYRNKGGRNRFGQTCASLADFARIWPIFGLAPPFIPPTNLANFAQTRSLSRKCGQYCLISQFLDLRPRLLHPPVARRRAGSRTSDGRARLSALGCEAASGPSREFRAWIFWRFSRLFAEHLRSIAQYCGDPDLCLKTTHKFCGKWRRARKISKTRT